MWRELDPPLRGDCMKWREKKKDLPKCFNVEVGKQSKMNMEYRIFHFQLFVLFMLV